MKISTLRVDAQAALEGDWVDNLEGLGDFAVKIKSLDCPQADRYQTELYRTILGRRATRRDKSIPPEIRDYVQCKALADICVTDWRNWEDDAGESVTFSRDALGAELFIDAPAGVETHTAKGRVHIYHTPDKKAYNYAMKYLYLALLESANRVEAPDEDEDEGKNSSRTGSVGDTDSVGA